MLEYVGLSVDGTGAVSPTVATTFRQQFVKLLRGGSCWSWWHHWRTFAAVFRRLLYLKTKHQHNLVVSISVLPLFVVWQIHFNTRVALVSGAYGAKHARVRPSVMQCVLAVRETVVIRESRAGWVSWHKASPVPSPVPSISPYTHLSQKGEVAQHLMVSRYTTIVLPPRSCIGPAFIGTWRGTCHLVKKERRKSLNISRNFNRQLQKTYMYTLKWLRNVMGPKIIYYQVASVPFWLGRKQWQTGHWDILVGVWRGPSTRSYFSVDLGGPVLIWKENSVAYKWLCRH